MNEIDQLNSFENSVNELVNLSRSILSLECFIEDYSIESMSGVELDMAIHYIDGAIGNTSLQFESFEESITPASDAAVGSEGESKGAKVKKFATDALDKMKEKIKDLPAEIKKYSELIMNTLTQSSKGLSNSAKQILDKLDGIESISGKMDASIVFEDVRPQAAIASLAKGIESIGKDAESAYRVVGKLSEDATSNLTLYNYKGTEFKFDGTNKFFDMKIPSEKTSVNKLSISDIRTTCERIVTLAKSIEDTKERLPKIVDLLDVSIRKARTDTAKDGAKAAMALGSFYRSVVGGYIKYTIKISKLSLGYANGSLKQEAKKDD